MKTNIAVTSVYLLLLFGYCCSYSLESSQVFCMSPSAYAASTTVNKSQEEKNVLELVPAERGDRIELKCLLCRDEDDLEITSTSEDDDPSPRLWYQQDSLGAWHEVELGMAAPLTKNRIYVTARHTLVIQRFDPTHDAGHYQCRGLDGDDPSDFIAYLLDVLVPLNVSEPYVSGNMSLWSKFDERLEPLGAVLDEAAGDEAPDVTMHWSSWGPCEDCEAGRGERWRRGRCRIIAPAFLHLLPFNLTAISCRSSLLSRVNISSESREKFLAVPDFLLYESCDCLHEDYSSAEQALELHHELNEGDDLKLVCPGANAHEVVEWKKGIELVAAGVWTKVGREARMRVDTLGTLHIERAEPPTSGRYSCRAARKTWHFRVVVEQEFILASAEFQHHLLYLVAALCACLLLYLLYVSMLCCETPEVRDKIIFGEQASSSNKQGYLELSYEELNAMASCNQISGVSMDSSLEMSIASDDEEWQPLCHPVHSPLRCHSMPLATSSPLQTPPRLLRTRSLQNAPVHSPRAGSPFLEIRTQPRVGVQGRVVPSPNHQKGL